MKTMPALNFCAHRSNMKRISEGETDCADRKRSILANSLTHYTFELRIRIKYPIPSARDYMKYFAERYIFRFFSVFRDFNKNI